MRTLYECFIECTVNEILEDIPDVDNNSVPLKASFYLEDVEMWKENGDPEYPCRVYMYNGQSYGLWGINYKDFNKTMKGFLEKYNDFESNLRNFETKN